MHALHLCTLQVLSGSCVTFLPALLICVTSCCCAHSDVRKHFMPVSSNTSSRNVWQLRLLQEWKSFTPSLESNFVARILGKHGLQVSLWCCWPCTWAITGQWSSQQIQVLLELEVGQLASSRKRFLGVWIVVGRSWWAYLGMRVLGQTTLGP